MKPISFMAEWRVSEVAQSCPTLWDPVDCSPPGSSVHGILQARILEWVAISFSRGSSWPRDWTKVSHIAGRRFTIWTEGFRGRQMDMTYKGNFDGFTKKWTLMEENTNGNYLRHISM